MIITDKNRVRLTASELNRLRKHNAVNGNVVNEVRTHEELNAAVNGALDPDMQADLLQFLETGSSPRSPGRTERN